MVKYLIFNSLSDALYRSHQIAISQGAGQPDDVTQYWFGAIEHTDGRAALEIDDDSFLNEEEREELKDELWMQHEGWF